MRMRYKKHLPERLEKCAEKFLARESEDFYNTPTTERDFVVDVQGAFKNNRPIILEIGCGKGAYALTCAKLHPKNNYVAVEKLSNVIVVGAERAQAEKLDNLMFLNCSAENLLYFLPHHCVEEIILNFSCPFPKKGYTNRRLTYKTFLEKYKLLLKPGGVIRQKTDDEQFFAFSLEQYAQNGFEVFDVTYDLHAEERENVVTEYEAKFVALGKKICACGARLTKNELKSE